MRLHLVNEDYLSNLIVLSKEQNDETFIAQLLQNLRHEFQLFSKDTRPWITDFSQKKEFQQRIHRLKNNFYNLGCEEAGAVLEEMYQALKVDQPDSSALQSMWTRFEHASELTFVELESTLQRH